MRSSCPRGLGWRLSRSQRERTRREDRHLNFYGLRDNLLGPGTPFHVTLCLDCGRTEIKLWALGDVGELHIGAEGWTNPAIAIRALKRTLESRLETHTDPDDAEQ